MSKLRFRFSVQGEDVIDDIKDSIERGIRNSAKPIAQDAESTAKAKIREEGAVWRGTLLESFTWRVEKRNKRLRIVIDNTADHAAPLEVGATYVEKGPPVEELIPWVISELQGWVVRDGGLKPKETGGSGGDVQIDFEPIETLPSEFQGDINANELSSDDLDQIEEALSDVGAVGNLSLLEELRDHNPAEGHETAVAYANTEADADGNITLQEIYVDPGQFNDSEIEEYFQSGFAVARNRKEVLYHEITHLLHHQNIIGTGIHSSFWPSWVTEAQKNAIKNQISTYAATTPAEFVAEVGALLLSGRQDEVSDELMGIYARLRGPDLP